MGLVLTTESLGYEFVDDSEGPLAVDVSAGLVLVDDAKGVVVADDSEGLLPINSVEGLVLVSNSLRFLLSVDPVGLVPADDSVVLAKAGSVAAELELSVFEDGHCSDTSLC